jgi:hypothetical protein
VHRVLFSSFSLPDSFSTVLRASAPIFKFCAPRFVFKVAECDGSRIHVLRTRTRFRRYRGRRVPFSCFALPDSFSMVPRASCPDFMFCALRLVSDGTEGVGFRFHVLLARTCFWRYQGRQVPFSCFARPNSFLAVPRASAPVFMFCAPGLVFGGAECVGSHFMFFALGLVFGGTEGIKSYFHVLLSLTRFRRYRGRRVPFSCFKPELVFGGTEGVASRFHIFPSQNRFRRYRGRQVPFSCFALPD